MNLFFTVLMVVAGVSAAFAAGYDRMPWMICFSMFFMLLAVLDIGDSMYEFGYEDGAEDVLCDQSSTSSMP